MKQNRRGIIAIVSPAAWLIHSRTARMLNRIECFTDSIRFRGEIKPLTVGVKTDACRFWTRDYAKWMRILIDYRIAVDFIWFF